MPLPFPIISKTVKRGRWSIINEWFYHLITTTSIDNSLHSLWYSFAYRVFHDQNTTYWKCIKNFGPFWVTWKYKRCWEPLLLVNKKHALHHRRSCYNTHFVPLLSPDFFSINWETYQQWPLVCLLSKQFHHWQALNNQYLKKIRERNDEM